jgi:hypothetical protein
MIDTQAIRQRWESVKPHNLRLLLLELGVAMFQVLSENFAHYGLRGCHSGSGWN